jgi:hypothetical protein
MTRNTSEQPLFDDDDRKHLDIVQGIIGRLAGNQFLIKGWTLTVGAAIFGYSALHRQPLVAMLGVAAASGFWALDAYFLRQERLFRHLWVAITTRPRLSGLNVYSLNVGRYRDDVRYFGWRRDENGRMRAGAALAGSVVGLHGILIAIGAVILVATAHSSPSPSHTAPSTPSRSATAPPPHR